MKRAASNRTFRRRLVVAVSLLACGVLLATSVAVYWMVRTELFDALDTTLEAIARIEVASATDGPEGHLHVHDEFSLSQEPIGLAFEKFVVVKSASGEVLAQTVNLGDGPGLVTSSELEHAASQGRVSIGEAWRGRARLRCIYYPSADVDGTALVTVVAMPVAGIEASLDSLLSALAVTIIFGLVGIGGGAVLLAGRFTAPLERFAQSVDEIGLTNLEQRIPEVSADVEFTTLQRALNAMLQRLDDAFASQREFIADASHELRSPVANLRGTLEVTLRKERSGEDYRETLAIALGEAERLSRLVNDLMMLSRIDSNQLVLDVRNCDLAEIVRAAVDVVQSAATTGGCSIVTDLSPAEIQADRGRIRQVVDNLLSNALRYAPVQSAVHIAVRIDGDEASIAVRDEGPGMSAEEAKRVFERFYRTDSARGRDSGGLGLGLSIACAIVRAHGGCILVDTAPGRGCRFDVRLPRHPSRRASATMKVRHGSEDANLADRGDFGLSASAWSPTSGAVRTDSGAHRRT